MPWPITSHIDTSAHRHSHTSKLQRKQRREEEEEEEGESFVCSEYVISQIVCCSNKQHYKENPKKKTMNYFSTLVRIPVVLLMFIYSILYFPFFPSLLLISPPRFYSHAKSAFKQQFHHFQKCLRFQFHCFGSRSFRIFRISAFSFIYFHPTNINGSRYDTVDIGTNS